MNFITKAAVVMIGVSAAVTLQGCAMGHKDKESAEGPEVKIKFQDAPAAVQETLKREADGAVIADLDKEMDDGKTIFEADAMIAGKNYEIKVAADGSLISKKLDAEEGTEKAEEKEEKK